MGIHQKREVEGVSKKVVVHRVERGDHSLMGTWCLHLGVLGGSQEVPRIHSTTTERQVVPKRVELGGVDPTPAGVAFERECPFGYVF